MRYLITLLLTSMVFMTINLNASSNIVREKVIGQYGCRNCEYFTTIIYIEPYTNRVCTRIINYTTSGRPMMVLDCMSLEDSGRFLKEMRKKGVKYDSQ